MGVANDKLNGKVSKPGDLAAHANNLAAATAAPHEALKSDSLVVDNNVLVGINELMGGMSWNDLQGHKKQGINWLRKHGDPPLPPLKGDPPERGMIDIIGEGHDLRSANVVLGEHTPVAGLDQSGFQITIGRDSTQYNAVLAELAQTPDAIGQNKGDADRAIVADTMFAVSPRGPSSRASPFVMPMSAVLLAEYRAKPGNGAYTATLLPMLMMRPPAPMCRAAARAARNTSLL